MKKYGLIGYPLSHSFSKRFFTGKFDRENKGESYENYEISSIEMLPGIISENSELSGLNVTIPYKEKVIPYLDETDPAAAAIGAVNTIRIFREGETIRLKGYNSDVFGFETSLKPFLMEYHKKALILGTGGASKAIRYVLKNSGIDFISASIEELRENEIRYDQINREIIAQCLLIINATPLGTYPNTGTYPPIPYNYLTDKHYLFDLVYNPPVSKFLEFGAARGATIKNGLEMLELQALRSYEIWNSVP